MGQIGQVGQTGALDRIRIAPLVNRDQTRLDQMQRASEAGDAEETARQFETILATLFVRELRRSMPSGIFGQGPGSDVYEGWFDEHLGDALAREDALGVAGMIKATIARKQASMEDAEQSAAQPDSPTTEPRPEEPAP